MRKVRLRFLKVTGIFPPPALLALACLLAACASTSKGKDSFPTEAPSLVSPAERIPAGDGLDTPQFLSLPGPAKDYLETLAGAFRKKDKDFLISQGESQYEKELRSRYDEQTYLALLYRLGPYSEDLPWSPPQPPLLDTAKILAIEYTEWEEIGPMLQIKGRIFLENDQPNPCEIMLVWRLDKPKILGRWP